jgi:hypothetical protein
MRHTVIQILILLQDLVFFVSIEEHIYLSISVQLWVNRAGLRILKALC